ncbi:MAG: chemotaxis response regulator protein-glutamate methylesterase [Tateyamaria sp.]|nr:chemotaxis response regulator protein-glutamate methylesterase [Tateyamaria sp.]
MINKPQNSGEKIKVLIVDDSAAVRSALCSIIESAPDLEVFGIASDPYVAAQKMRINLPDVIFLDIEMPRMDGLTFLRKIMSQRPIPVVICSTLTEQGSQKFMEALEAGAVEAIAKPKVATAEALIEARMRICDVARAAAHARVGTRHRALPPVTVEEKLTADAILPKMNIRRNLPYETDTIVAIGASTGGTEALATVLKSLPADCPGLAIVQHMPEGFTAAFARRVDGMCAIKVKEAAHGDMVAPGQALIAPGNRHLIIERVGRSFRAAVRDGPPVSRHRPSVDVLFRSVAQTGGSNTLGIIMTGMGDDGAQGLLEMRQAGARTIAQDEASCTVFGMPKEAIARGGAERVLGLNKISGEIARFPGNIGQEKAS